MNDSNDANSVLDLNTVKEQRKEALNRALELKKVEKQLRLEKKAGLVKITFRIDQANKQDFYSKVGDGQASKVINDLIKLYNNQDLKVINDLIHIFNHQEYKIDLLQMMKNENL